MKERVVAAILESYAKHGRAATVQQGAERAWAAVQPALAELIDWIETELDKDGDEFRDIPDILADARTRFVGAPSSTRPEEQP